MKIEIEEGLTRNKLRDILKSQANNLHMKDIMLASSFLREDAKYMPAQYREDYIDRFSRAFFTRIREIKEDTENYTGRVDVEKLREFILVLDEQDKSAEDPNEKCFVKIARIIATYTTFVRRKPIHPVGTKFPGGFVLHIENNKFLCPVKERQMKNPNALCKFCVSKQDKNAL